MVHLKLKGVNWVENIPNYMTVLNELASEEFGRHSPFKIYYGCISNFKSRFTMEHNSLRRYKFQFSYIFKNPEVIGSY